jgi:hypothetical protein
MNCDKEYRYEVRDIVIVKVDTETGEEVLNRDNSIKHFRPKRVTLFHITLLSMMTGGGYLSVL